MTDNSLKLSAKAVAQNLKTHLIGKDFHFFDRVTSTFDASDTIKISHGSVVCAVTQTNGRGRLGRSWQSDSGGIYFSVILQNCFEAEKLQLMTAVCALGVQMGISEYIDCKIKWPNDIISANGMKICGILTKLRTEDGCLKHINVGIGINANTEEFAPELCYASSLKNLLGHSVDENLILCSVLQKIENCLAMSEPEILKEYSRRCVTLKSRVKVIYADGKESFTGECIEINNDGSLKIQRDDGNLINVNSGEVSVRGVYGESYV